MNKFKLSSEKETNAFIRKVYLEGMIELLQEYKKTPREDLMMLIKQLGTTAKQFK